MLDIATSLSQTKVVLEVAEDRGRLGELLVVPGGLGLEVDDARLGVGDDLLVLGEIALALGQLRLGATTRVAEVDKISPGGKEWKAGRTC